MHPTIEQARLLQSTELRGDLSRGSAAPVVIVTHDAKRAAIDAALQRIGSLNVNLADPVAIRIEEV